MSRQASSTALVDAIQLTCLFHSTLWRLPVFLSAVVTPVSSPLSLSCKYTWLCFNYNCFLYYKKVLLSHIGRQGEGCGGELRGMSFPIRCLLSADYCVLVSGIALESRRLGAGRTWRQMLTTLGDVCSGLTIQK